MMKEILKLIILACVLMINAVCMADVRKHSTLFFDILPYAQLANAIYMDKSTLDKVVRDNQLELEFVENISGVEVSYALLKDKINHQSIVVIRGTANAENAFVDMDVAQVLDEISGISVHQGFLTSARAIYDQLINKLKKQENITITGHSLGGAVAVVLAMQLRKSGFIIGDVITFGQPKVSNIPGSKKIDELHLLRVVTPKDPVPVLPPVDPTDFNNMNIYWHGGIEIILLGQQKYALLRGMDAILRGGEFLMYIPDQKNIEGHYMQGYLDRVTENLTSSIQVKYMPSFNLKKFFGFGG